MVDAVGERNHMASLRENNLFGKKWPKFSSFLLILQHWSRKIVVNTKRASRVLILPSNLSEQNDDLTICCSYLLKSWQCDNLSSPINYKVQ